MKTLTRTALVELLQAHKGASFVTITARTSVRMNKTGNPYVGAYKISRVNGIIGWAYETSVNNQRSREGTTEVFESHPRKWGVRDSATTVSHKGNYYLELKIEKSLETAYFLQDGTPTTVETFASFMPKRRESSRQKVENPVILRDYKVDNITAIAYNGEVYNITG